MPPRFRIRRFAGTAAHAQRLAHLRVAHLTDLHVGTITPMRVQYAAVELANASRPDLVALTGDFVCHSQRHLDELQDVVSRFDAPVVCVLGNHDHWSGATEVRKALRRAGAEILDNANTIITLRRQQLQLVGVDDAFTGNHDWRRAIKGMRKNVPTLGLSHIAEVADKLWPAGVPLVLSGHTHGGQITVARLHELTVGKIAGHKYIHGLYGDRSCDGAVYVGAGVGSSLVPLRLGDRGKREVAFFELGAEAGAFAEDHQEQPSHPGRPPSERAKRRRMVTAMRKSWRRSRSARLGS